VKESNAELHRRIAIVSLGRKGAGVDLTQWLLHFYQSKNVYPDLYLSNEALASIAYERSKGIVLGFHTFSFAFEALGSIQRSFKTARIISDHLSSNQITDVIFPMPHVWDLILWFKIKKLECNVIRFIHDDKAHKGEIFPPKWFISSLLNRSDVIICFSNYVSSRIKIKGSSPIVAELPSLIPIISSNIIFDKQKNLLFLGRIHKYKGIGLLCDAYSKLDNKRPPLLIAGLGKIKKIDLVGVSLINRWLSNNEIVEMLRECDVLLLPYLEASQSGLIPIAKILRVKIAYTPVGGLQEQLADYDKAVMATDPSPLAFSVAIMKALSNEFDVVSLTNSKKTLSSVLSYISLEG
jgi:glycosyltransferase involved in cell wall biosynthesis